MIAIRVRTAKGVPKRWLEAAFFEWKTLSSMDTEYNAIKIFSNRHFEGLRFSMKTVLMLRL